HRHRGRVRLAGARIAAARVGTAARLPDRARRSGAAGRRVRPAESAGGRAVRVHRPAHPPESPGRMSAVQTIAARAGGLQPVVPARPASWRLALGSPQCVFGAILVVVFVFLGVFGPALAPYNYDDQDLGSQYRPPIWAGGQADHPLGTDQFGRDILSRLLYGARVSLLVGLFSVVLAGAIGVTIGVVSGYLGGNVERFFMRVADVQYAFPYILLAIIITAFWGPSLVSLIVALGLAGWMTFARTARASTLSVKEREYIVAARALGASHGRIML